MDSNQTNQYKKRSGTAGIRGHLYETKLISLIFFRLKYDNNIEEFQLATNMNDIGAFDDICFKAKVKGFDKPLAVFIQAKHREGDKLLTINTSEMAKYLTSYLKIKKAFKQKDNKGIFEEKTFDDNECLFVLYTTAKDDPNNSVAYQGGLDKRLNVIIGTGDGYNVTQPSSNFDMEFLRLIVLKEQITSLAVNMANFLSDESNESIELSMNNDRMLRFHVILAQKVFDVSEIQPEGHRVATFREEFFSNNEELLLIFKYTLSMEILKRQESGKTLITETFCCDTSNITALSEIIGIVFTYKNEKFEFIDKIPEHVKKQLENVSQSFLNEAIDLSVIKTLKLRTFKVPSSFGNRDLTIRGTEAKVERRLNHLTSKIIDLMNNSKPNHIILLHDNLGDGFLQLNGGLASAVGNLFVSDGKLLKITDNYESLGVLAQKLYDKLQKEIHDIHVYRFEVTVNKFSQLSFQTSTQDEAVAREFLNKFLFYTNQANEKEVEEILKIEIEDHQSNDIHNDMSFRVKSDAMFLKFHDKIQEWWMTPTGTYLTKESDIYETSIKTIVNEPLMTVINMMHVMNNKNTDLTFCEDAVNALQLQEQKTRYFIDSESNPHTLIKVEQFLKEKERDYVVLDLEYIIKLPANDFKTLLDEMKNISQEKSIVILCNMHNYRNYFKRLETVSSTANGENVIFIIHTSCSEVMKNYVLQSDNVLNDEKINLIDMSEESKQVIFNSLCHLIVD